MVQDFVEVLKAEIASIEAELAKDVRMQRLKYLREVLPLYQNPSTEEPVKGGVETSSAPRRPPVRTMSDTRRRALEIIRSFLAHRSEPAPTRVILDHLNKNGIEIGGSSPSNNLSALLSTSGEFDPHGKSGWSLKSRQEEDPEQAQSSAEPVQAKLGMTTPPSTLPPLPPLPLPSKSE
jgi:hypothetical protein